MSTIYPVILPVPDTIKNRKGRAGAAYLSGYARCALKISCRKSGIFLSRILKNENGSPLPFEGYFWSLTHKPKYVGAVVAPSGIGMDVEEIRPRPAALFRKIADDREWNLTNADPDKLFFRYWTSKESVLKASGKGLGDLSKCRIEEVIDETMLMIRYGEKNYSSPTVISMGISPRWSKTILIFNGPFQRRRQPGFSARKTALTESTLSR